LEFVKNELGLERIETVRLDYRTDKWVSGTELKRSLEENSRNTRIVWIYGFEEILRDERRDLIIELQNIYRESDQRLVLVCEANYYDKTFENLILSLPSFDPRISLHGNYEDAQLVEFVEYLVQKWKITISNEIRAQILAAVGSNLRLIKLIIWHLRDKGIDKLPEALASPEVWWQVRSLWNKLSESEKKVVLAHAYGLQETEDLAMSREYVEKMRLLEMPMLVKFVRKYIGNPLEATVNNDQLLIGGKDYSIYFTDKQKMILREVLREPGAIVTRDLLLSTVGLESDWALDSQINRLRKRLKEIGLSDKYLVTKRGKGVLWQS